MSKKIINQKTFLEDLVGNDSKKHKRALNNALDIRKFEIELY